MWSFPINDLLCKKQIYDDIALLGNSGNKKIMKNHKKNSIIKMPWLAFHVTVCNILCIINGGSCIWKLVQPVRSSNARFSWSLVTRCDHHRLFSCSLTCELYFWNLIFIQQPVDMEIYIRYFIHIMQKINILRCYLSNIECITLVKICDVFSWTKTSL